jgi:putative transcriptional regulator
MTKRDFLTDQFLIAMPGLADPNFHHTVTYICEHNEEGALGIILNRPMNMELREILLHIDVEPTEPSSGEIPVYMGGPVQPERGFVLHHPLGNWEATMRINAEVGITSSRDVLAAIAEGHGPEKLLIALGYAGWGAGQLEEEMAANAWLSGPADQHILFDLPPEQKWEAAAAKLGVDLKLLSGDVGHA